MTPLTLAAESERCFSQLSHERLIAVNEALKKNCKEQSKSLDLVNGWEITSARIPRQETAGYYFPNYYSGEWTESG